MENVPGFKEAIEVVKKTTVVTSIETQPTTDNRQPTTDNQQPTTKVSSLSLSSIKAKKELLEAQKGIIKGLNMPINWEIKGIR